jgi:hypothetical protein
MTEPETHPTDRIARGAAVALLLGLAGVLAWICVSRLSGGAKLPYPSAAAPALGAGLLLGVAVLVALGSAGAAFVGVVILDALALVVIVWALALVRAPLAVVLPLLALVAALVAVALLTRIPGALTRRVASAGAQAAYAGLLVVCTALAGPGRPGIRAWLLVGLVLVTAAAVAWVAASGAPGAVERRLARLPTWAQALLVYLASLIGFVAASGSRLARPTLNNHFVYLADGFLKGQVKLSPEQLRRKTKLQQYDDWAKVEKVRLREPLRTRRGVMAPGTVLRGAWITEQGRRTDRFRTTRGLVVVLRPGAVTPAGEDWYVSFPPLPAVLMLPGVAVAGYDFNDVQFSVGLAALAPMLLFLLLLRVRRLRGSAPAPGEDLWWTALFAFGTVNYFVAVRGEVWYTAQVSGLVFLLLYLHAALEARRPLLAGLALGAAVASRVDLALAFLFFVLEAVRPALAPAGATLAEQLRRLVRREVVVKLALFALPLLAVAAVLMWYNAARFDAPFEFGHRYLDIYWKDRIQKFGLFDIHYLSRNLSAALTFLPHFQAEPPYVLIGRHGLSVLFVTPVFLLLLWPRQRTAWHPGLWASVAGMALLTLCYQNTGFVQFAYRFSLDYTPLLVLLLALSGRALTPAVKTLILWGILVNLLGALTFGLMPELYGRTNWVWTPLDPACAC